jgi:DNA-binding transcriptional ArsR family regulator
MSAAVDLDATFQALADKTRRGVIELLRAEPRRAGELSARLDTSRPAMSRHLRVLRQTGLVQEERSPDDARGRVYRLRREPFDALHGWLEEIEAFWSEQLGAFRAHAEQKAGVRHEPGDV